MAYATAAQLKQYLGITGTGDDSLLTDLLTRAQAAIERRTGRVFEVSTLTYRAIGAQHIDGDTLYFGGADVCAWYTGAPPTNFHITTAPGNTSVLPFTDAIGVPMSGPPFFGLRILPGASVTWADLQYDSDHPYIMLGALWAYSQTPPDDIVHATIRLAAYYYRQRDAQVYDVTAMPDAGAILVPKGIPADVDMILRPYVRMI